MGRPCSLVASGIIGAAACGGEVYERDDYAATSASIVPPHHQHHCNAAGVVDRLLV